MNNKIWMHDYSWRNTFFKEEEDISKELKDIYGSAVAKSMDVIVKCIESLNMSPEQIAETIKDFDDSIKSGIHLCALLKKDELTACKIEKAMLILDEKLIKEFKDAVASDKTNDLLSRMTVNDKETLLVKMGLFRYETPNEKPFTEEEQKYHDILQSSIHEDIKVLATCQGFKSVEEWQEHNSRVFSSMRKFIITK